MRFAYTIAYVDDPAAAARWYEQALGLELGFVSPEGDYAELATGEVTLAFAATELGDTNIPSGFGRLDGDEPAGVEIGFVTDEVSAAVARVVSAGGELLTPPTQKPWGQIVAWVRDPNGLVIEIATPVR